MRDYRINTEINCSMIRLKYSGELISYSEALKIAKNNNTDLIELCTYNDNQIAVCILQDYQKFIYKQKRREKKLKVNQIKNITKEIRFGPQIEEHDYSFKLKHIREFILDNKKVKACVIFKGREITFKDQGKNLLLKLANDLIDVAKIESGPLLEGKRMSITLIPK